MARPPPQARRGWLPRQRKQDAHEPVGSCLFSEAAASLCQLIKRLGRGLCPLSRSKDHFPNGWRPGPLERCGERAYLGLRGKMGQAGLQVPMSEASEFERRSVALDGFGEQGSPLELTIVALLSQADIKEHRAK